MTRIIETPGWAAAVQLPEEQMYERNQAVQRLLQAATVADVKDLVRLCRQESAGDIDTAIALLGSLAVSNDPRFRRADLVNWLKVIRKLARAAFPRRAHGQRAVGVLAKLDQAGCERILLATELRGLSQSEHSQVLLTLRGLGTPRAVQRLEQLAKGRSRVAKAATSELIRMRGTGAAVGSPSPDDYAAAVDTIYHAFGQWSENGDLEVMADAIAASASQLAELASPEAARAVDWGRGSPLLAAGLETEARFAYLTPQELVACQGAVAQARSRVVDGPAGEVTSTVLRWILEAASQEGHGLFVELWP